MKVCTSINAFFDPAYKVPVEVQIQRTLDGGFRYLDMPFWDYCVHPGSPFMAEGWEKWTDGAAAYALAHGGQFVQGHAHVYNFAQKRDEYQDMLLARSLEGATRMGIRYLVYHPAWDGESDWAATLAQNLAYYRPLIKRAEEVGVGIAIENTSRENNPWSRVEAIAELVDRLESPMAANCYDTGHAHIRGLDPAESIRYLGHRLHALHVQDNDARRDEHMPPFFGTLDWDAVCSALKDIDFQQPFTFEAHMIIRRVPETCKNDAVQLLYKIGMAIAGEE